MRLLRVFDAFATCSCSMNYEENASNGNLELNQWLSRLEPMIVSGRGDN